MGTLVRRSGRPLNAEVPGLFTYDGFHGFVLPTLGDLAASTAVENWVLGSTKEEELSDDELAQLQDGFSTSTMTTTSSSGSCCSVTSPSPLGDLQHSVDVLKAVAGENSPIKLLLHAIVRETKLTVPPPTEEEGSEAGTAEAAQAALKAGGKALGKLSGKAQRLAKLAKLGGGGAPPKPSRWWPHRSKSTLPISRRSWKAGKGRPRRSTKRLAPSPRSITSCKEIVLSPSPQEELRRGGLAGVAVRLEQQATGLPAPLDGWLVGIAETTAGMGEDAISRRLNALWRAEVLPFCNKAIAGRFPFESGSTVDVSLADFSQLFRPGGLIDQFMTTHLLAYVDTRDGLGARRPAWASRAAPWAPSSSPSRIRDGMFAGGAQPQMRFALKPLDLDTGARRAVLDLDGQTLSYDHGPAQPASMEWPGPNGRNVVRLTFIPLDQQTPLVTSREGAWSWFRLLREGQTVPTGVPGSSRSPSAPPATGCASS